MKINHEKMAELGFKFDTVEDVYLYFSSMLDWLESHNKNYTKDQYNRILTLQDIFNCLIAEEQKKIIQNEKI